MRDYYPPKFVVHEIFRMERRGPRAFICRVVGGDFKKSVVLIKSHIMSIMLSISSSLYFAAIFSACRRMNFMASFRQTCCYQTFLLALEGLHLR